MTAGVTDEEYYFRQGEAFLYPSMHLYHEDGGALYNACLPAFTICEAFAAEAYLKSLIRIETGESSPSVHNLKTLFGKLLPETQRVIRRAWLNRFAKSALNVSQGSGPDGKPFEAKVPKTFEEALDLSAQAFVKWRYDFREHHGWHMRGLGPLIRRKILMDRPDWRPEMGSYFSRLDPHPQFVKPKHEEPSGSTSEGTKFSYKSALFKVQVRSGPYTSRS